MTACAILASVCAVALTLRLDQRDFLHGTACNSGPTLLFTVRQLSYETMVSLQRQPTRGTDYPTAFSTVFRRVPILSI